MDIELEIEKLKRQNQYLFEELLDARNDISVLECELDRLESPLAHAGKLSESHPLYKKGTKYEKKLKEDWKNL